MEWVSARDVIESLGGSAGEATDSPIARSVMRHALEGRIPARATEFRRITEYVSDTQREVEIPSEFWTNTKGHVIEQDWIAGTFAALNPNLGYREEWKAYGVVFAKDAVVALGGKFDSATKRLSENHAGGRPRGEQWPEFIAELCLWAYDVQHPSKMNSSRLLAEINDRLAKRGIDEMPRSTARETLVAVVKAFKRLQA